MWIFLAVIALILKAVIVYDLTQRKHAVLRNYPVIGHFRYLLETVGPELRQYIVTSNNEERPFSRDQRSWVYASSKLQNNYSGFGTDDELELSPNFLIIKHSAFPLKSVHPGEPEYDPAHPTPCCENTRWPPPEKKGVPPRFDRQYFGNELRIAQCASH